MSRYKRLVCYFPSAFRVSVRDLLVGVFVGFLEVLEFSLFRPVRFLGRPNLVKMVLDNFLGCMRRNGDETGS